MEVSAYGIALIAGGFTIIGALVTIGGAHRLAIHLEAIKRQQSAAAKLRASFAPAKVHLKFPQSLGNPEARKFFETALTRHAIAIEEFRPFAKNSTTYQEAWEDYQNTVYGNDALGDSDLKWSSGMITSEDHQQNLNFLEVIEEKIDNILHFAIPK